MAKQIVIIGGGASGLTAAVFAAREGARVTLLEHNDRPGRKLNATGNGKCNLTNINQYRDSYRGSHPSFVHEALQEFSVQDTIRFFSELGIYTKNKNGYLYPHSAQASSVTEVLVMEARYRKVKIKTQEHVTGLSYDGTAWNVQTKTWNYTADAVILASGSPASSIPGAEGSGYDLAEKLGHQIIKPLPALVGLRCKGSHNVWAGVRIEGAVTLCINDLPLKTEKGELQLTDYGISGIPVFQLSRYAVRAIDEGCRVTLLVDFFPEFTKEAFAALLDKRKKDCPYKNDKELLTGLFPDKLTGVFIKEKNLIQGVKEYRLQVTRAHSLESAQICSGGVDVSDICSSTMESRLCPGLYFAGEIMDVDGACGGYNLQWAWTSGALAGACAAKESV